MSYSREDKLADDFHFKKVELKTDRGLILNQLPFYQTKILPKLLKYCEIHQRDPILIEKLDDGFCNGIAIVCLNAIASTLTGQGGNSLSWFESCTSLLEKLDEKQMRNLSQSEQKQIDDFLGLIEGFQHAQDYEAVSQGQLQVSLSAAGVQYNQVGKLAGAFTPGDFLKSIDISRTETKGEPTDKKAATAKTEKMIDLIAQEGSISLIVSHNHATGIFTTNKYYYYFDANQGLYQIPRSEKTTLIKLFSYAHYKNTLNELGWSTSPYPLSFNIVARQKKDHPLAHPKIVEAIINRTDLVEKDSLTKLEFGYADKYTPLHMAAWEGDVASLDAWLKKYKKDGKLKEALNKKYERKLNTTVEDEYDLKEDKKESGVVKNSPLVIAAQRGHARFVEKYLENFGDINPEEINTAFSTAITHQFLDAAAILTPYIENIDLNNTIIPNKYTQTYNYPIYLAARLNHLDLAKALVAQRASLTKVNKDDGNTALHIALKQGNKDMIDFLIATLNPTKENYNLINKEGETILHLAAEKGYDTIVDKILKVDPSLANKADRAGNTPLHTLAKSSNTKLVARYIQELKEFDITNKAGETPLHIAAQYGNNDTISILIDKGAKLQADNEGNTPLHHAARNGKVDTIKMLIKEYKADIGSTNHSGQTPFFLAVLRGRDAVAMELKKHGSKGELILTDIVGNSPLHLLSNNSPELIKKLVTTYDLDINQKNSLGETPLITAINENKSNLIKAFLEQKGNHPKNTIDVNLADESKQTPLQHAVNRNNKELVQLLLLHGANVNNVTNAKSESFFSSEFKANKPELFKIWLERKKENDALTISEGDAFVLANWIKNGIIKSSDIIKKQINIKEGSSLNDWLITYEVIRASEVKALAPKFSAIPKESVAETHGPTFGSSRIKFEDKNPDISKAVISSQEMQLLEKHLYKLMTYPAALELDAFRIIDDIGNSKLSNIMNNPKLDKNTKFYSLVKILYDNLDVKKTGEEKKLSGTLTARLFPSGGKTSIHEDEIQLVCDEIYHILKNIIAKHPEFKLDLTSFGPSSSRP